MKIFSCAVAALTWVSLGAPALPAAEQWQAIISPQNSLEFDGVKDGTRVFRLGMGGWGPNWQWGGLGAKAKATGEKLSLAAPFIVNKARGEVINIPCDAQGVEG